VDVSGVFFDDHFALRRRRCACRCVLRPKEPGMGGKQEGG
jgi:hypothetical protein